MISTFIAVARRHADGWGICMWQEREGAITHVCFVTAGTATAPVEGAEYGPAVFFYAATNADGSHGVVCEADDKGAKERCVSLRRIPPAWGGGWKRVQCDSVLAPLFGTTLRLVRTQAARGERDGGQPALLRGTARRGVPGQVIQPYGVHQDGGRGGVEAPAGREASHHGGHVVHPGDMGGRASAGVRLRP